MAQWEINNNGDSAATLLEQNIEVMEACDALIVAMSKAVSHGRNYQTVTDGTEKRLDDIDSMKSMVNQVNEIKDVYRADAMKANQHGRQ